VYFDVNWFQAPSNEQSTLCNGTTDKLVAAKAIIWQFLGRIAADIECEEDQAWGRSRGEHTLTAENKAISMVGTLVGGFEENISVPQ